MGFYGPLGPGGFRRRGRRRGLIVGAAVGSSMARRSAANNASSTGNSAVNSDDGSVDYEAELTKLKELKDKDLITDEEYQQKRQQVLGV